MRDNAALAIERAEPAPEPSAAPAHEPPPPLKKVAARGAVWIFAGYGGAQVLRFGGNLILTRLLLTEAFGLMALVNVFLLGLQLFSDIGIGPSIIQNERGDERRFLDTAWTMQAVRGLLLFLITCAAALPLANFYDEPSLGVLLPVAAGTVILSGLFSTKLFALTRHLEFRRLTMIELGSQAAGLVTMVTWALVSPSVWALVAGGIAIALVKMVSSHVLLAGTNNRFRWDPTAAAAVFRFGKWIFLSTVLTFMVGQSDRLVFATLIPLGLLGVYSIGLMIAQLPQMALGQLALNLVFPLFSRIHNRGDDIVPTFRRVRAAMLAIGGWMLAGLVAGGPAAVELLYDQRYLGAGWIVQMLAIGTWFYTLEATNGAGLLALGRPKWVAAAGAGKLVGMLILIPVGYSLAGFPGAVAGFALAEVLRYVVSAFAASKAGLPGRGQDLALTALFFGSAQLGWMAERASAATGAGAGLRSAVVFGVCSACFAPLGFMLLHQYRGHGTAPKTGSDV